MVRETEHTLHLPRCVIPLGLDFNSLCVLGGGVLRVCLLHSDTCILGAKGHRKEQEKVIEVLHRSRRQ